MLKYILRIKQKNVEVNFFFFFFSFFLQSDRQLTTLPGLQEQLIQAVYAANKNTIVVLIHGAPLSIEWLSLAHIRAMETHASHSPLQQDAGQCAEYP